MNQIEQRTFEEQPTAVVRATLTVPEIGPWIGQALGQVAGHVAAAGGMIAGPPFASYTMLGEERFAVEAGFPLVAAVPGDGAVETSTLPGGEAAVIMHVGPYDSMQPAYEAIEAWVAERGTQTAPPREVYFSDPAAEPDPATWRTEIIQPFQPR